MEGEEKWLALEEELTEVNVELADIVFEMMLDEASEELAQIISMRNLWFSFQKFIKTPYKYQNLRFTNALEVKLNMDSFACLVSSTYENFLILLGAYSSFTLILSSTS